MGAGLKRARAAAKATRKAKWWVFVTYYECPVCGRGGEERDRRHDERPDDRDKRSKFEQRYDYCMERQ